MSLSDLYLLRRKNPDEGFLKMTKMRTVTFIMMIISTCALVVSLSDAHPVEGSHPEANAPELPSKPSTDSRLVVTHIVKTVEFEVGLLEDDGTEDNSTRPTTPDVDEAEAKPLNVDLGDGSAAGGSPAKREASEMTGDGESSESGGSDQSKREADDEWDESREEPDDSDSLEVMSKRRADGGEGDREPAKGEAESTGEPAEGDENTGSEKKKDEGEGSVARN